MKSIRSDILNNTLWMTVREPLRDSVSNFMGIFDWGTVHRSLFSPIKILIWESIWCSVDDFIRDYESDYEIN